MCSIEGHLQKLRKLVAQLRADNEKLRQEQLLDAFPGPSAVGMGGPSVPPQLPP